MLTKKEAVRSLICTAMNLCIISICQRLCESVTNFILFRSEILKASEDCLVVSLGTAVAILMAHCCGEVFKGKQSS